MLTGIIESAGGIGWYNLNCRSPYVARPFSFHFSGGVNAAYADGHVGFLSETIPYCAYHQLMTPDGTNSDMPDPDAPHE